MKIKCTPEGNTVRIKVKDLFPRRMYSVWAIWLLDPGTEDRRLTAIPFGGNPNMYITDKNGRAAFKRDLNFCPWDAAEEGVDGNRLLFIDSPFRSDQSLYGAVPSPITGGRPPGTVIHLHLEWDFGTGVPLEIE